jgi:hypothetical protein
MRSPALVFRDAIRGAAQGADLVSLELEQLSKCGAYALLVVDYENPAIHSRQ